MKLTDRVVIITGAAGGIGSAGVRVFAKAGAKVIIADVSQTSRVQSTIAEVMRRYGQIDVLWNNATALRGCSEHDAPVHALPEAEWDFIQNVTLRGVYLCSKYVLPHMMAAKRGVIINTSSTDALIGLPG